jgi:hypothetical protein
LRAREARPCRGGRRSLRGGGDATVIKNKLLETGCQWTNLNYDDKVIVINSKTELEKYIECAPNGIYGIDTAFFKNESNKYTLKVTVHLGITMVAETWRIFYSYTQNTQ